MIIYISGPMKNKPNLNSAMFRKAAEIIRAHGHYPIVPHDFSPRMDEGEEEEHYYLRCLEIDKMIIDHVASAIAFLPGGEESRGVALEREWAHEAHRPTAMFTEDEIRLLASL